MFDSYASLTHAYLRPIFFLPLVSFSSVMGTFEIFHWKKIGVVKYAHIQFRG